MNLFALPCFKRYPVITPPLKASRLNKRRGEGQLIRGSAVFITNLKNENQETFRLFDSTCMHRKCHARHNNIKIYNVVCLQEFNV